MPEMYFHVRWPDDSAMACYSPSTTIRDAFKLGASYSVAEFVERSRTALTHASTRVANKYGYGCSHALHQIEEIEARAAAFADRENTYVTVEAFGDEP